MVDYVFLDGTNVIKVRTDAVDVNTNNFTILEVNDKPGGFNDIATALQKSIGSTNLAIGPVGDLSSQVSIGRLKTIASANSMNLIAFPVGSTSSSTPVTVASNITLSAPTLTAATGSGASGTTAISWTAVTNAANYVLDRATNSGFTTGVALAIFSGNKLTFNDSGLTPSTTYFYRVRAQNAPQGFTDSANSTVQSAAAHT